MRNHDVAEMLERLSLLSEASGEDRFKAIAYRRAATSIKNLGEDVDEVRKRGELTQIQYIGEGIAKKIDEYLRTGKLEFVERLEKEVPEGTLELMQVPGIGSRTAYKLSKEYGVKSVAQLKADLGEGKLKDALGEVMSKRILESVERMKTGQSRMLMVEALYLSRDLVGYFESHGVKVDVAGSLRRGKSTVGDLDILCGEKAGADLLVEYPGVERVIEKGPTKTSVFLKNGVQVDVRVLGAEEYGAGLLYFTGSKEHNILLRNIAIGKGWKLNEYGLFANTSRGRGSRGRARPRSTRSWG